MVEMFTEADKTLARGQRNRLLLVWFILLGVYLAAVGTMIGVNLYQVIVYADRTYRALYTALSAILTALFGGYTLFFFSLKFRMTHKYCKMLKDIDRGLKDTTDGSFLRYDDTVTMKDGVYFYAMELDCKPLRRDDITLRKVLIEHTAPKPDLYEGDKIRFTTHANILIEYEILKKAERPQPEPEQEGETL